MTRLHALVLICTLSIIGISNASANEVEIVQVELEPSAHRWTFHVTLKHQDKGWDHYADSFRIVDEKGNQLGFRKLWHPHVDEQPFTGDLADVLIPKGISVFYVEAHDLKHGWSKQRVKIDLRKDKGKKYQIRRPKLQLKQS